MSRTLTDKIWDEHLVAEPDGQEPILYIDLHLLHEVTSPQAFAALRLGGRRLRCPERTLAMVDHNISTDPGRNLHIADPQSRAQVQALRANAEAHGISLYDIDHPSQGIVHVVGPEQGHSQPGQTIVCGDSHTTTHGALGALAFGIGTSQLEHVLATQTLRCSRPRNMALQYSGTLAPGVSAKDLVLHSIRIMGVGGASGHIIEYSGAPVSSMDMAGRMTLCNMSVEAGARGGIIAPDQRTIAWLEGLPASPRGRDWERALERWERLYSDPDAQYERTLQIDCSAVEPCVSWGTNPSQVVGISEKIPDPEEFAEKPMQRSAENALRYMGLNPGDRLAGTPIDRVFIGSCTNARLEDLRSAASVADGRRVADGVRAMVVPGSGPVRRQAEDEGLDDIFVRAGFEWRQPGCSLCLGMNPDRLAPGERCASTSNRNFEGRQGRGGRTHLLSPAMAAAAAVTGQITDLRELH